MAHFMRDDIGGCEVAAGMEALAKLIEEAGVEIDFAVRRAVERTHGRLGHAATRLIGLRIKNQGCRPILQALGSEQISPTPLRRAKHLQDHMLGLRIQRPGRRLAAALHA